MRAPTTPTLQAIALSIECEKALKAIRAKHKQEEQDLKSHYRKLIHEIVFPKRKK